MNGSDYYGAIEPAERKSWKLCYAHQNCQKCQKTLHSWKSKCGRHSFNAQRSKFALMCFLQGQTREHDITLQGDRAEFFNSVGRLNPVPICDDPEFTGTTEEIEKQVKENELYGCGICNEKCVKDGKKKPIIYGCGHTNCAECFNEWCKTKHDANEPITCPYCRQEITKAIRLFVGV
tara:strand:+ start:253 stop:783 length:531 start_codon:yes stop_codon:yes gene_type:complete